MNWSPYAIMWIFLFFDIPSRSKQEKREAYAFRSNLEKEGFRMFQYSVYTRLCGSRQAANLKMERVKRLIPHNGHVSMLVVTDKQYGQIVNLWNSHDIPLSSPVQLSLF